MTTTNCSFPRLTSHPALCPPSRPSPSSTRARGGGGGGGLDCAADSGAPAALATLSTPAAPQAGDDAPGGARGASSRSSAANAAAAGRDTSSSPRPVVTPKLDQSINKSIHRRTRAPPPFPFASFTSLWRRRRGLLKEGRHPTAAAAADPPRRPRPPSPARALNHAACLDVGWIGIDCVLSPLLGT